MIALLVGADSRNSNCTCADVMASRADSNTIDNNLLNPRHLSFMVPLPLGSSFPGVGFILNFLLKCQKYENALLISFGFCASSTGAIYTTSTFNCLVSGQMLPKLKPQSWLRMDLFIGSTPLQQFKEVPVALRPLSGLLCVAYHPKTRTRC